MKNSTTSNVQSAVVATQHQGNMSLTPAEAASIAKVSKRTLARWEEAGLLRGTRVNARVVRYSASQLARLLGVTTN